MFILKNQKLRINIKIRNAKMDPKHNSGHNNILD